MRSVKTLLILVILTTILTGCGLSGPLYLPDGTKSIKPDAPDDIDKQINNTKNNKSSNE